MGLENRDYYREGTPAPGLGGSVVVQLVVLNCVVFLANLFLGGDQDKVVRALELMPQSLLHPIQWYRLLTYGFTHDPQSILHILCNMIGLYSFGRVLEDRFGWKEFLRFYLLAIVLSGLVWTARNLLLNSVLVANFGGQAVNHVLYGASGGVTAVVLLFCLLYPRATVLLMFVVPAPAWVLGIIIVATDMLAGHGDGIAHDVHLTGGLFALGYWYFGWNLGRLPGMAELGKWGRSLGKSFKPRPDLRVHDPEAHYEDLDAEGDRVLEKLNREGEQSLSRRERQILEAYSRRMRQKLR
jgi:membrane associated rhomboid family serine protease